MHSLNRASVFPILFLILLFSPICLCANEISDIEGEMSDSRTGTVHVWVAEIEMGEIILPEGVDGLLKPGLEGTLSALEGMELLEGSSGADIIIRPICTDYKLEQDPVLGYVASLDFKLRMDGRYEGTADVRTVAEGASPYAAVRRAVYDVCRQAAYYLEETALWSPGIRIIDAAAGRAILNAGRKDGIRVGQEFFHGPGAYGPVLLKVSAVFGDFSEAHYFKRPAELLYGQRVYPVNRIGLKTTVGGRYNFAFPLEEEVSSWSFFTRTYLDRWLFDVNPLFGLEHIREWGTFFHLGAGLNWYFGPFVCVPSVGGIAGFPNGKAESGYWGGFWELGLQLLISKRFVLHGEVGGSSLYYAGSDFNDLQFIYSGLGLMLKY